jgi:hypothetical protein
MQSGRIFYGRLWLKKGCLGNDDDDDDDDDLERGHRMSTTHFSRPSSSFIYSSIDFPVETARINDL